MSSKLIIINNALIRCGADTITQEELDNPTTKRAKLAVVQFDVTLKELLADSPWNFAIKRAVVTKNGTPPVYGYASRYQLPADCLRVLNIDRCSQPFEVEGGFIVTNEKSSDIKIQYISHTVEYARYSATFLKALWLGLASDLSYALVQSTTLQDKIISEAERFLRKARSYNSQEGTPESRYSDAYTMGIRQ